MLMHLSLLLFEGAKYSDYQTVYNSSKALVDEVVVFVSDKERDYGIWDLKFLDPRKFWGLANFQGRLKFFKAG